MGVKGVTSSVTFKISTLFGETDAFLTLKPSDAQLTFKFARDKNNFVVSPSVDCKVTLDFSLDVPSQKYNILWQIFLAGFTPTLNSAINGNICGTVKKMTT